MLDRCSPSTAPLRALDTATRALTAYCRGANVDTDALDAAVTELDRRGWICCHQARTLVIAGRARAGTDNQAAIDVWSEAAPSSRPATRTASRSVPAPARPPRTPGQAGPDRDHRSRRPHLRELEVVRLTIEGLATREIGERLFIGRRTVETHLTNAYAKLGIRSRVELVRIADQFAEPAAP